MRRSPKVDVKKSTNLFPHRPTKHGQCRWLPVERELIKYEGKKFFRMKKKTNKKYSKNLQYSARNCSFLIIRWQEIVVQTKKTTLNIKLMLLMSKLLVTCTIAHIEKSRSIVKMRQNMSIKITISIFLVDFYFDSSCFACLFISYEESRRVDSDSLSRFLTYYFHKNQAKKH